MASQIADQGQVQVDLQIEIPEALLGPMSEYLEQHKDWSQHRMFAAALSLFLMQHNGGQSDRSVSQVYLGSMFDYEQ